jgi:hypothetical protein
MKTIRTTLGALLAGATLLVSGAVIADSAPKNTLSGRSKVYKNLDPASLESPTSAADIRNIGVGELAPPRSGRDSRRARRRSASTASRSSPS